MSSQEFLGILDEDLKKALTVANSEQRKILLRVHFLMEQQEMAVKEKNSDLVVSLVEEIMELVRKLVNPYLEKP